MFNNGFSPYVPNLGNGGGFSQPMTNPVRSNKIYVTDANDAMTRPALPDTLMLYVQQDESAIHEVYTDPQGRKMIKTRTFSDIVKEKNTDSQSMVTRKEFEELKAAVEKMAEDMKHDES